MPTRADLDEAAPEHPAVFTWQYANKQVQILNSKAIELAAAQHDLADADRHVAELAAGWFAAHLRARSDDK